MHQAMTQQDAATVHAAGMRSARRFLALNAWAYRYADDIISDALFGAAGAATRFNGTGHLFGWCGKRADGAILDGVRRRTPQPLRSYTAGEQQPEWSKPALALTTLDQPEEWLGGPQPEPDDVDSRDAVVRILQHLTQRERIVLVAVTGYGVPLKEIGEQLGVTESRVCQIHKAALERARAASMNASRLDAAS